MKILKLLSKLGLKSKPKAKPSENKEIKEVKSQVSLDLADSRYPKSTFELVKKHGNEPEAQNVIIKRLEELDEVARGYVLDSLMDSYGEDPKTLNLLDKYVNKLPEEDKIWTLRDFAFHHGDIKTIRELIGKHIYTLNPENKYYLLTDLTVHHGSNIDVQKVIIKYLDHLSNQHKYDILYCLSHLHGLDQNVQNLILTNLNGLSETQVKEIFRGLIPKVATDLIGKHIDSLSEKNRDILIKNATKQKQAETFENSNEGEQKSKSSKKPNLEKTEILLLDLSNIRRKKTSEGKDDFKVFFSNPVKIFPYVKEKNDDTQIGDAFLSIKDNKIFATVTLCPPLRKSSKMIKNVKPIYKPSGNLSLSSGVAKELSVDFIYLVF